MIKFLYKIDIFFVIVCICTLIACSSSEHKESATSVNSNKSFNSLEIKRSEEVKQSLKDFSKYKEIWKTKVLKAFEEKSLETLPDNVNEVYRFIWIPSFEPAITIRIWQSKDKYFLVSKKPKGEGYEIRKLSYENTKRLSKGEWLKFVELVDQVSFWNLPTVDIDEEPETDGATYSLEGNKNSKFHEVHRTTNNEKMKEIGTFLTKLSELKTKFDSY